MDNVPGLEGFCRVSISSSKTLSRSQRCLAFRLRHLLSSQDSRAPLSCPTPSPQQPGTIVEMVLVPCLPGTPRDKCGVTLKLVKGSASFTTSNGQTISLSQANQVVSINGNSVVSQSSQPDSILNFASTSSTRHHR